MIAIIAKSARISSTEHRRLTVQLEDVEHLCEAIGISPKYINEYTYCWESVTKECHNEVQQTISEQQVPQV